ncbi:MAG: hypothetical protein PF569_03700 [Candidatus Woesearchaeota archaeon]|jgi:hypothetical protein|nr:hypothetical protein [Candidatus Woesearchaeota archaeon]
MYQFTTTTIINSALDSNGTSDKFSGANSVFNVARTGSFKKDNILFTSKNPYKAGVKEIAEVTIPTITAGLVARIEIDVQLSQQTGSDYASAYLNFHRPLYIEVLATGTAATDATALKNEINKIRDRYGFSYVTATTSGADLIITATDPYQRIKSIKIFKEAGYTDNSIIEPAYEDVSASTFSVTTDGVSGFGTDDWMTRNIMIQTAENVRHFGLHKDERPVIGGNYTQYTLEYSIEKDGSTGIVAGHKSITTHVFYVLSSLVTSFEAALINASIEIDTVGTAVSAVTVTSSDLGVSDTVTNGYQLTYTTTPTGVTGGIWTRDTTTDVDALNSDADFTKVLVSATGEVTLETGHGLAVDDVLGFKITIDGSTFAKTIAVVA